MTRKAKKQNMVIQFTCDECSSGIEVYPNKESTHIKCGICGHVDEVSFESSICEGDILKCPKNSCQETSFYTQRDFNRKIGVILFLTASILSIYTYGMSFIILYAFDFFLYKKLSTIVICYHCGTIFRGVKNLNTIEGFDHETNDRIVYSE